jgi:putative ABC transport system ATP-binding protein
METILTVCGLKKEYGSRGTRFAALHDVDLEVQRGEFLAVMGPSGSGKTTLLNLMSTIDKATAGEIYFEGRNLAMLKNSELAKLRRHKIGFVFQDFNLLDNMTIMDNIALPLALNRANHKVIMAAVEELAAFFGITDQLPKYPYQLSGGQKQRSAVARALITKPAVVFADEPTGALDTKASAELLECLCGLKPKYGTTVVMVTHDAFCASFSDRVMFLKDGTLHARLDSSGSRKDFYQKILEMLAAMGGIINERL